MPLPVVICLYFFHCSVRQYVNHDFGSQTKCVDKVVRAGDELSNTLTEKQEELFEDYMTAQREVNVLTDIETFCLAFKLGAKIMLDVLTESQIREI